jgi:serine/threonine-protein kinase
MAPEVLKGQEATIRSDVYALGLVLYELFTGKRAVEARTLADALLHHTTDRAITTPSKWISDLDPLVERTILRCLEKDPSRRPASAIHVAASLPGGDPLQAALAAGETPSPEMVAAAGSRETMRPAVAVTILAATIVLLLGGSWARSRISVLGRIPLELPPEVLAHRASEVLNQFGYSEIPRDTAQGFEYNNDFVRWVRLEVPRESRWNRLEKGQPSAVWFWYRTSPTPLRVTELVLAPAAPVTVTNPSLSEPGMTLIELDPSGRLVRFRALPDLSESLPVDGAVDWRTIFAAADLDAGSFRPASPTVLPERGVDTRMAWTGAHPEQPDLSLRIEAASSRGRIVAVEMFAPWRDRIRPDMSPPSTRRCCC